MTLEATISLPEAASRRWDALVVGAGVAGSAVAGALAEKGRSVLLLERGHLPRDKVCGGCLSGRAVASLERLGLMAAVEAREPAPLQGVLFRHGRREAVLRYPDGPASQSRALSRRSLDVALAAEAIRRGAAYRDGAQVLGSRLTEGERVVEVRAGSESFSLRADVVLACDGLGGALAREAGLAEEPPRGESVKIGASILLPSGAVEGPAGWILMSCGAGGYVGAVQVESGLWNIAGALRRDFVRESGGPLPAMKEILASCGLRVVVEPEAESSLIACPALRRRTHRPWADRLLLVGDAAGYFEPVTGEGMAWALASAEEAARVAGENWTDSSGPRYEAAWRRRVARRRGMIRAAAWLLDAPWRTGLAVSALQVAPALGRMAARRLNRE
jgi:flavin-dependent dehydrogenase